jgi:hypothetical protein
MSGDRLVRIALPCTAPFARVARTVAAACGAIEGFSVDELADIRLLIDEVFVTMHELGVSRLELVLDPAAGRLPVTMAALDPRGPRRGDVDASFAQALASRLAVDVRVELDERHPHFSATFVALDGASR